MKHLRYLLLLFALSGCSQEKEVVILSINDLHAKFENLDKMVTYVHQQQADHKNVLLLCAGDLFIGNSIVDYYFDKGFPMIDILNNLVFDVGMMGGHDFDYGLATLFRRVQQSKVRNVVCANVNTEGTVLPTPPPFLFFTKDGIRICVIGLMEDDAKLPEGVTVSDPIETFAQYETLRGECDLFIALTHIGVTRDSILAERYGSLDLIVGGYSHTKLDSGKWVNGVLITQAGRYGQQMGKTVIKMKGGKVVSKSNHLIEVADLVERDSATTKKIQQYNDNPDLYRVVGWLNNDVVGRMNIGNFFCDAIRAQTKSDIVFQNIMGIRSDLLSAGPVAVKDIFRADPFANELVKFETTGDEILQFIKDTYLKYPRLDLCVSGLKYKIQVVNGQPVAVKATVNGAPIAAGKRYTVVTNNYIAASYKLPVARGAGASLNMTTVDAIESYIKINKKVGFESDTRAELY